MRGMNCSVGMAWYGGDQRQWLTAWRLSRAGSETGEWGCYDRLPLEVMS